MGAVATTVPMILGPTGIGKSRAAFEVARALGGEIVVCDSRQVYDRLDIATNKPSPEDMRAVPYHLVGVADPRTTYTAHDFVAAANAAMAGIAARPERRAELERLPIAELACMVRRLDPDARVDERNPVRLVRAIEVLEVTGPPLAGSRTRRPPPWTPVRVGLTADLEVIDARL